MSGACSLNEKRKSQAVPCQMPSTVDAWSCYFLIISELASRPPSFRCSRTKFLVYFRESQPRLRPSAPCCVHPGAPGVAPFVKEGPSVSPPTGSCPGRVPAVSQSISRRVTCPLEEPRTPLPASKGACRVGTQAVKFSPTQKLAGFPENYS